MASPRADDRRDGHWLMQPHHAAPRRQKPASVATWGQKNADAGVLRAELRRGSGVWEGDTGSALGAPAAGAGAVAHRGADDRVLRACADARSRRSCAAVGRPAGGRLAWPRQRSHLSSRGSKCPRSLSRMGFRKRALLREPLPVEQLADVPVPETVILARGRCALGVVCYHVAARVGGATGGWVAHTMSSGAP